MLVSTGADAESLVRGAIFFGVGYVQYRRAFEVGALIANLGRAARAVHINLLADVKIGPIENETHDSANDANA